MNTERSAGNWQQVLKTLLEAVAGPESRQIQWLVIGSVAAALQGVSVSPRDLDLLFRHRDGLAWLTQSMAPFTPADTPADSWVSTVSEPIRTETFAGYFRWHKAIWTISGMTVDATAIENLGMPDGLNGPGAWEGGEHVWACAREVAFAGYAVPVSLLEIQLEAQYRRGLTERIEAILDALHVQGPDIQLLGMVLAEKHLADALHRLKARASGKSDSLL